jgi:hypothetical protein
MPVRRFAGPWPENRHGSKISKKQCRIRQRKAILCLSRDRKSAFYRGQELEGQAVKGVEGTDRAT